ncbi:unnamed protein product [Blepharisma stoltei]|uniref:Uncharacterized protein n=1 Tax=Blepharisma stoltei TaxID=1481888 RepID=A0AAU9IUH0_9CILI|nr:unnamed protein product [Blepharisma stoltei]
MGDYKYSMGICFSQRKQIMQSWSSGRLENIAYMRQKVAETRILNAPILNLRNSSLYSRRKAELNQMCDNSQDLTQST